MLYREGRRLAEEDPKTFGYSKGKWWFIPEVGSSSECFLDVARNGCIQS